MLEVHGVVLLDDVPELRIGHLHSRSSASTQASGLGMHFLSPRHFSLAFRARLPGSAMDSAPFSFYPDQTRE